MQTNYNPISETKKGNPALTIILVVIILGLVGFIVYDKCIKQQPEPKQVECDCAKEQNTQEPSDPGIVNIPTDTTQTTQTDDKTTTKTDDKTTTTVKLLTNAEALKIATPLFKKMVKLRGLFEDGTGGQANCEAFKVGGVIPVCLYEGLNGSSDLLGDFNSIYASEVIFESVFKEIDDDTVFVDDEGEYLDEYFNGTLLYTEKDDKYYTISECNRSGAGISANQTLKVKKIEENKMTFTFVATFAGNEKYNKKLVLVKENGTWKIGNGTDIPNGCN